MVGVEGVSHRHQSDVRAIEPLDNRPQLRSRTGDTGELRHNESVGVAGGDPLERVGESRASKSLTRRRLKLGHELAEEKAALPALARDHLGLLPELPCAGGSGRGATRIANDGNSVCGNAVRTPSSGRCLVSGEVP
jgi:hypothetical protein